MKVVICAAGDSKRMGKLTKTIPKPLLPLDQKSIIENLIRSIAIEPVDEIIIVVGYLDGQIKAKIGNSFNGIKVSYVKNEDYSNTNNMYSIYLTRSKIDSDVVFIPADIYLTPRACRAFIKDNNPNSIIVDDDNRHFSLDDPVKVTIIKDNITAIDKKLPLNQINGVAVGMYKLSLNSIQEFFKIAEDFIKERHLNYGYIEPIKILLKTHKFTPFYIEKEPWYDIDTYEEYKKLKISLEGGKYNESLL